MKFADQLDAAFDLRREGHHVDGAVVSDPGKRVEVGRVFESPKVLAMKGAALFAVNKRAFVVNAKNARRWHRLQSVIASARIITD